ncbi:GNAT family N-acetyltransferase [Lysinibacter cavernae]|uniref:Ribosomal-protein-alanine N-acetyltransferase n=1 Tax=Lysinibacter cavernae TaxID=1640652 RepID=A0A7X5R3J9_9MICO|nr:GNAT family protein [Lysinibacter cavernae]NIH55023.1 ribosomal-protein-alanine N-acetyltransferase [Lysinibacter cavernae]
MAELAPPLTYRDIVVRQLRVRDARQLERVLLENRDWLQQWEASLPGVAGPLVGQYNMRQVIRNLLSYARAGQGMPYLIEYKGQLVGQLSVSGLSGGSLSSASLGYWVTQASAGHGITPTAVALVTDYFFVARGLHRMEICIRPENGPSLRVVQKLGFRHEGRRDRYIHIDGDWRDHECFALVAEEIPEGVLSRWTNGRVLEQPLPGQAEVPSPDFPRATGESTLETPPNTPAA